MQEERGCLSSSVGGGCTGRGSGSGGRGVRIAALSGRWFIRCVRVLYVLN